tara:strand:- start:1632 stop:2924 length:1293 start_codon:yes stop_codon:yes gene_type:complete
MIKNIIYKIEKSSIDIYLFLFLLFFLTFKIFILSNHYIEHDELVNLTTYFYKETIFLKNYPNNHFFISFLGLITEFFVGTKLVFLKFINYLSLPIILYISYLSFKNKFLTYLLFLIYLLSDLLFTYSFVLRGYYISSLFFCLIFYLILEIHYKAEIKKLNLIYLICALQVINNISSLYLVVPILFSILLNLKTFTLREKFKFFFIYFLTIFFIFNLTQILITGLYIEGYYNSTKNLFSYISQNYNNIFTAGFERIYLSTFTSYPLSENIKNFVFQLRDNIDILTIFSLTFFTILFNIYKRKLTIFDLIVIYFFIFFFLINKFPPERVYVGFIYFFIFYLFFNIKNFKFKINLINYFIILIIFIVIYFEKNPYRNLQTLMATEKKIMNEFVCNLKKSRIQEIEKHMYYYLYLKNCNRKRNLKEFINFYRGN